MCDKQLKEAIKDILAPKILVAFLMLGLGVIPTGFVGAFGKHTAKDFWDSFMGFYTDPALSMPVLAPILILAAMQLGLGIKRREICPKHLPVLFPLLFILVCGGLLFLQCCVIFGNFMRLTLSKFWPFLAELPDNRTASYLAFPTFFFLWVLFTTLVCKRLFSPLPQRKSFFPQS